MGITINQPNTSHSSKSKLISEWRVCCCFTIFQTQHVMGLIHLVIVVEMKLEIILKHEDDLKYDRVTKNQNGFYLYSLHPEKNTFR